MNLEGVEDCCLQDIEKFKKENKEFLENKIIQSFLQDAKNRELFIEVICNPTEESRKKLDKVFKKFYFNIRFTSFISTALYFNAINFDKRHRKIFSRHPLTLDKSLGDDEGTSFKDMIVDSNAEIHVEDFLNSGSIEDYIVDPLLYEAVQALSEKQKEVIDLAYVKGLSDTEISKILNKSQQAISKMHKRALQNIYTYITEKGGMRDDCNRNASVDNDFG